MIQIILSGQQSVHNLTDDDQGWVAGIIIYILESHVDGAAVVILENFNLVSKGADSWLQQVEVNGRHLRAEDCVILFHGLGKDSSVVSAGYDFMAIVFLIPHPQSGNERTNPDSRSSQVIDLIDLENRINFSGFC